MQVQTADTADQANTARVVVDLYGQHLERNRQHRTLEILLQTCTSAVEEFGSKTFAQLKPVHVSNWLAKMAKPRDTKTRKGMKWGPTYQNIALRTLVAAFNWAKSQGLISAHCLENPKAVTVKNRKRSRGQEAYISPATWKTLMDRVGATNHGFADLLVVLRAECETAIGGRPLEPARRGSLCAGALAGMTEPKADAGRLARLVVIMNLADEWPTGLWLDGLAAYCRNRAAYDAILGDSVPAQLRVEGAAREYRNNANPTALGDWQVFAYQVNQQRQAPAPALRPGSRPSTPGPAVCTT